MSAVLERKRNAEHCPGADGSKAYRRGTHRTVDPAATFARVQPYLAGMGITRVANVTGLDRIGVPVVMVCRPNSRSLAVSQGKGLTLDAAKASGVMEAIELYHAERIELPLKLGSARELARTHRLVDLDALPRRADSRFHPDLPMLWIEGRNLLDRRADAGCPTRWSTPTTPCRCRPAAAAFPRAPTASPPAIISSRRSVTASAR